MSTPSTSPRAGRWGLTRAERMRSALEPGAFQLDGRGMVERMALARRFASLIAYTDLAGDEQGDWAPFLASDPSFLSAEIALDADTAPATPEQLRLAVGRLDGWYRELEAQNDVQLARAPDAVFVTLHAQIAGELGPTLRALDASGAGLWAGGAGLLSLSPVWGTGAGDDYSAPVAVTPAQACARFAEAGRRLAACARRALEHSLEQDRHPPHTGLLLAFLRLLDLARDDLNQFTGRHLDYYFRDTLRMRERQAQPGEATIVLTLAPSCPALDLPAGTRFRAGQDAAGKTIVYSSTAAVQINQASVAALSTLLLERDGAGIVRAVHAAPVADSADGMGAPLAEPALGWPAFGSARAPAALPGCVIAAPVLALAQGARTVTLALGLEPGADALARAYLEAGAPSLGAAFVLNLSGAGGWFAPGAGFTLTAGAGNDQWQLEFTLAAGEEALAANPALLPTLDSPWPMLRLCLDPGARPYAYSYLAGLRLRSVAITVRVAGLTALQLATGGGPVAGSRPFAAFGNAPLPGQYLQVAHPELSLKDVSQVTLHVQWMNLPLVAPAAAPAAVHGPLTPAGPAYTFADYYTGYAPYAFSDASFTVAAAAYADGAWTALAGAPLALFPQAGGAASTFALDLAPLRWSYAQAVAGLGRPVAAPARCALRLTLATPAYGFGSAIFPGLFAQQAIAAVKAELAPQDKGILARLWAWIRHLFGKGPKPAPRATPGVDAPVVLPNPPFVPVAGAVSLDYTASESPPLAAHDGLPAQFCQLTPFGCVVNRDPAPPLFPSEADDGHLYLGIAGAAGGQTLELHVELREGGDAAVALGQGEGAEESRAVLWRWMSANAWHDVPPSSIVSRTVDFGRSGIVSLRLPPQLDVGNTALPGDLFWIEARVARAPERYPRVVAILPQALVVRRDLNDGAAGAPHALPAGSVNAVLTPLPAVKSVSQPYPGRSGVAAETLDDFRTRVSERLRHKQRASQARDYEQLVLAATPALWQVKCIGPNDSAGFDASWRVAPGGLVLAVAASGGAEPQLAAPVARADLAELAALVRSLCSPAVRTIQVRNVAWESLCVTVDVRYVPGADVAACDAALNAALQAALAPPPPYPARLAIGCGALQVDQVAALVRAQGYVAQAGPVTVVQRFLDGPPGGGPLSWSEGQVVRSRTPWSVLVPAPRHAIGVLADGDGVAPARLEPEPEPVPAPMPAPVYTLSIAHPAPEPEPEPEAT